MHQAEIRTQTYNVTVTDNVRYHLTTYYSGMVRWPAVLVYLAIILIPPSLSAWARHADLQRTSLYVCLSLLFWLVVLPIITVISVIASIRKSSTLTGRRVTTLTTTGIVTEGDGYDVRQDWSAFREVQVAGRAVYIRAHLRTALVVPATAFADDAERAAFIATVRQQIRDANHRQIGVFSEPPKPADNLKGLKTGPFALTFPLFIVYSLPVVYRAFLRPGLLILMFAGFVCVPLWTARARIVAGDWAGPLTSAIIGMSAFMLIFPLAMTIISWIVYRRKPGFSGERIVGIDDDGITAQGPQMNVSVKWRDIRNISRYLGCMTFWAGPQGGVMIGEAAFPDKAAADAFYAQARTSWQAARNPAAAKTTLDAKP